MDQLCFQANVDTYSSFKEHKTMPGLQMVQLWAYILLDFDNGFLDAQFCEQGSIFCVFCVSPAAFSPSLKRARLQRWRFPGFVCDGVTPGGREGNKRMSSGCEVDAV